MVASLSPTLLALICLRVGYLIYCFPLVFLLSCKLFLTTSTLFNHCILFIFVSGPFRTPTWFSSIALSPVSRWFLSNIISRLCHPPFSEVSSTLLPVFSALFLYLFSCRFTFFGDSRLPVCSSPFSYFLFVLVTILHYAKPVFYSFSDG
jgi:hypothetical protein